MRIIQLLVFLTLFGILSCQDIPDVKKPEPFIEQSLMEDILYESVLVNSAKGYNPAELKLIGIQPQSYIYDKFDIDSATYAQNLAYYIADLEKYRTMNTKVLEKVKAQFKIDDSIESLERKIEDSLRTMRAREIVDENKRRDSLGLNRIKPKPSPIISDSFARRYRGINKNLQ